MNDILELRRALSPNICSNMFDCIIAPHFNLNNILTNSINKLENLELIQYIMSILNMHIYAPLHIECSDTDLVVHAITHNFYRVSAGNRY